MYKNCFDGLTSGKKFQRHSSGGTARVLVRFRRPLGVNPLGFDYRFAFALGWFVILYSGSMLDLGDFRVLGVGPLPSFNLVARRYPPISSDVPLPRPLNLYPISHLGGYLSQ